MTLAGAVHQGRSTLSVLFVYFVCTFVSASYHSHIKCISLLYHCISHCIRTYQIARIKLVIRCDTTQVLRDFCGVRITKRITCVSLCIKWYQEVSTTQTDTQWYRSIHSDTTVIHSDNTVIPQWYHSDTTVIPQWYHADTQWYHSDTQWYRSIRAYQSISKAPYHKHRILHITIISLHISARICARTDMCDMWVIRNDTQWYEGTDKVDF